LNIKNKIKGLNCKTIYSVKTHNNTGKKVIILDEYIFLKNKRVREKLITNKMM
jgi:hypothetical protein